MRWLCPLLPLLVVLAFVVGAAVQAAHVGGMGGMPASAPAAMAMDEADPDACRGCDMDQDTEKATACKGACIAMPIALPEAPDVLASAPADPTLRHPALGSGTIPSPDPHPPRSVLRA